VREYLLCLFAAAAVTYLATAPVRRLAIRTGVMAEVRDRDVHAEPTPRLGGLAMFAGLLAGMLLASKLPRMREVFPHTHEWFGLLVGCALIVGLGIIDDRWGLDAPTKFAGQVLAAGVMAFEGVQVLYLPFGSGSVVLDPTTSIVLTVLVVIVTVNAINFVDGLDGLAGRRNRGDSGAGLLRILVSAFGPVRLPAGHDADTDLGLSGRNLPRVPSAQSLSGPNLHG
jgi:UDP-GlcNAc:undecaprenyl-phosphate GlcNAc-1-phosphate transferase